VQRLATATTLTVVVSLGMIGPVARADTPPAQAVVNVVAHEDDDTLFLSPDLYTQITRNIDTTTVYITAGENAPGATQSPELYAFARQTGVLSAYATMAASTGCNVSQAGSGGCWTLSSQTFAGHQVQQYALTARPNVRVIFLNLPENADTRYNSGGTLTKLWANTVPNTNSLAVNGAVVQNYTRGQLIDVLNAVMTAYSATVVRAQDPAPDLQLRPDHEDHTPASQFAGAAEAAYSATKPRVMLEDYHDYNIADLAINMNTAQRTAKKNIFEGQYMPNDVFVQSQVGTQAFNDTYAKWEQREYERDPRGTNWVTTDGANNIHAFVVQGGNLYEWVEHPDGTWAAPINHGNPGLPLANGLFVAHDQDGRMEVFGQSLGNYDIVSLYQSGSSWAWSDIGNPNAGTDAAQRVSTPAVTTNGDGRLQVFIRNGNGGVCSKWQGTINGGFVGSWGDMGGTNAQGQPSALMTNDGRIELFAPTVTGILHWYQPTANGGFTTDTTFPQAAAASGLTVAKDQDGRFELLTRQAGTANVTTTYQISVGGSWAGPGSFGGQGGLGNVTVVTDTTGRVLAAEHNANGGLSVSEQTAPNNAFGGWTDIGGLTVDEAAGITGPNGRTQLMAVNYDGKLYYSQQGTNNAFAAWQPAG
jgi:hypothetical protein